MGREEEIAYAREHGIPVKGGPRSALLDRRQPLGPFLGGPLIEDLEHAPDDDVFQLVTRPEEAPDEAQIVTIGFEAGLPVAIDGERLGLVDLIERAAEIGAARGRDRRPHRGPDRRPQGARHLRGAGGGADPHRPRGARAAGRRRSTRTSSSRGSTSKWGYLVYAGLWWEPLREDLDAYMDAVNAQVTGEIGLRLYKGSVRVVTRSSPNAVYDAELASFSESGGLFSQTASPGFIELWSLQSRMAHMIRRARGGGAD